jgi:acetoacetyl-CoA synthetase
MTHFGTSAKFIDRAAKAGVDPATHTLPALRAMLSTGSPLAPEGFDYVYEPREEGPCLSSISGGTDLVACFAGGCPILRCGAARCRRGSSAWSRGLRRRGTAASARPEGRARVHGSPSRRCRSASGTIPDGREVPRRLLREYPDVWRHGDWSESRRTTA